MPEQEVFPIDWMGDDEQFPPKPEAEKAAEEFFEEFNYIEWRQRLIQGLLQADQQHLFSDPESVKLSRIQNGRRIVW
jgi:hypothetical protein